MGDTLDAERRIGRAAWLRQALADLPTPYQGDTVDSRMASRMEYDRALAALQRRLEDGPDTPAPRIAIGGDVARVTMLGITSTSTMGLAGALRNWINRVERGVT